MIMDGEINTKDESRRKRIDVMVDLETLGTNLDAPVFQIAAVGFDIETGEILSEYIGLADVGKLTDEDGAIDGGTLKWWLKTDKELFAKLINSDSKSSPKEIMTGLYTWMKRINDEYGSVYLWGNGILFDNAIIRHKMEGYGLDYPIFFRNDRDVRTIFELARMKTGETEREMRERIYDDSVAHDAYNDTINQIRLVSQSHQIIVEGGR